METHPVYNVAVENYEYEESADVYVNGDLFVHFPNDDGCRGLYVNTDRTLMLKLEHHDDLRQFAIEAQIWQEIEDEDRKHFSPILAAGENGRCGWIVTTFYPDLESARGASVEQTELADRMAEKYNLNDWFLRQWKIRPDGSIVIHDFGISYSRDKHVEISEIAA